MFSPINIIHSRGQASSFCLFVCLFFVVVVVVVLFLFLFLFLFCFVLFCFWGGVNFFSCFFFVCLFCFFLFFVFFFGGEGGGVLFAVFLGQFVSSFALVEGVDVVIYGFAFYFFSRLYLIVLCKPI